MKAAREVEGDQVALKRPVFGHFLAAGNAGLRDPLEHEALGETAHVCIRAACPAHSNMQLAS